MISDAWIGFLLLVAMNNSRPERGKLVFSSWINRGKIQGRIAKLGPKYDEIINKRRFHKGF